MEEIKTMLRSINFDSVVFSKAALIIVVGTVLLAVIGRLIFGKHSTLNRCLSSAISILLIYAVTIVLYSLGARYQSFVAPLPFVSFSGTQMRIFSFLGADYTIICAELLSVIILAFLANLIDRIMPRGKHVLTWFLFRCLTIVLAMAAHLLVTGLFTTYLPEGLVTYAPTILLGLLILLLLVGALKFVVSAILSSVNPLIGAFYQFFFATLVGKALTKAILTGAILSAIVVGLNYIGCTTVAIDSAALIAYIPLLVILVIIWYVVGRVL